jgi:hypothetical protein
MKKTFIGMAVSLIPASMVSTSLWAAGIADQTPSLTISGEANGTYYAFRGSQREANGGRGNGHLIRAENTRINFDIFGKTTKWGGLEYGYLVGLSGSPEDGRNPVEENRLKLKGQWGTLFIGTHRGVDHVMPAGAYATAGATGGVLGGNYTDVINMTTGVNGSIDMVGTVKDTNRITYATPRVSGFQFGISLAPLGHQKGESKPNSYLNPGTEGKVFERNIVSLGLNFKKKLNDDWKVKLSVVGVFAKVEPGTRRTQTIAYGNNNINLNKYKRVASYALGGELSYKDFDIGIEFIDNGRSMVLADVPGADAGQVISIGMGYKFGQDRFSVGYIYGSKKQGDFARNGYNPRGRAQAVHLTWDRNLAPGLNVFAEANYFDYKTDQNTLRFQRLAKANKSELPEAVGNNHGHVLLSGIKVKF